MAKKGALNFLEVFASLHNEPTKKGYFKRVHNKKLVNVRHN